MASSSSVVMPGTHGRAGEGEHLGRGPARHAACARSRRGAAPGSPAGAPACRLGVGRAARSPAAPARVGLTPTRADVGVGGLVAALELLAAPAPARVVGLEHPVAASGEIGHEDEGVSVPPWVRACARAPPAGARGGRSSCVTVPMRLAVAAAQRRGRPDASRDVLLVHVRAAEADGWAECAVEPEPTYSPEFTDAALLVLRDHLLPAGLARARPATRWPSARTSTRCAATRWPGPRWSWRCSTPSSAPPSARSASWLGATATAVAAGAALGLHDDVDDLLAEADEALAAGAARLRVKIAPGPCRRPPRRRCATTSATTCVLQADANGSFDGGRPRARPARRGRPGVPRAAARARRPARPRPPRGAAATRRSASTSRSPRSAPSRPPSPSARARWCASSRPGSAGGSRREPCTTAAPSSACPCGSAGCSRPASGGPPTWRWPRSRTWRCPPDLDPRGRFDPDLADPRRPVDGAVPVPDGPGHRRGARSSSRYGDAEVVRGWSP